MTTGKMEIDLVYMCPALRKQRSAAHCVHPIN